MSGWCSKSVNSKLWIDKMTKKERRESEVLWNYFTYNLHISKEKKNSNFHSYRIGRDETFDKLKKTCLCINSLTFHCARRKQTLNAFLK